MSKTRNFLRPFSVKYVLYAFLLVVLIIVIVASFSPGILSKVASWVQTRTIGQNSSTMATPDSSFIPPHSTPVFDDSLKDKNDHYQWYTGSAGGARCFFVQGASYHISASAKSLGGGCNPELPKTPFTNFVYQMKMVIAQGASKELRAGIFFCANADVLGGSFYSVSFNSQGDWDFGVLTGGITGPAVATTLLSGSNSSFQKGTGQVNYITVRVTKDHQIDAQVNGKALFHRVDKRLSGGQIGVSISNTGADNADVAFNDARVWQL